MLRRLPCWFSYLVRNRFFDFAEIVNCGWVLHHHQDACYRYTILDLSGKSPKPQILYQRLARSYLVVSRFLLVSEIYKYLKFTLTMCAFLINLTVNYYLKTLHIPFKLRQFPPKYPSFTIFPKSQPARVCSERSRRRITDFRHFWILRYFLRSSFYVLT